MSDNKKKLEEYEAKRMQEDSVKAIDSHAKHIIGKDKGKKVEDVEEEKVIKK